MTISVEYNEAMIAKARRVADIARQFPHNQRDEVCRRICGLSYDYLKRVGKSFKRPSARTLMNLGFELYAKDLDSGELSLIDLGVKCDWNPTNPRANPTSTAIFSPEHLAESFGSE